MADNSGQLKAKTLPKGRSSLQEDIVTVDYRRNDLALQGTNKLVYVSAQS
jgi:hypothetical protein